MYHIYEKHQSGLKMVIGFKISIYNGSLRESNKKAGNLSVPVLAVTGILHHYHTITYNNTNQAKCQVIFPHMKYGAGFCKML